MAGMGVSMLLSLSAVIAAFVYGRKRFHAPVSSFFVGVGVFILFALVLESLLHNLIILTPVGQKIFGDMWLYALYGGAAAALFEETGRIFAAKTFLRRRNDSANAYMYGTGHGGVEEIFRRMTFNVLSANCDDHVKNFSFIMDRQGRWSLSPAYDLTFAYNPNNRWLREHQMTVNGKSRGITDEDLIESGRSMGLGTRFCRETIRDVRGVVSEWRLFAGRCGIESSTVDAIGSVIDRSGPLMRAM